MILIDSKIYSASTEIKLSSLFTQNWKFFLIYIIEDILYKLKYL